MSGVFKTILSFNSSVIYILYFQKKKLRYKQHLYRVAFVMT